MCPALSSHGFAKKDLASAEVRRRLFESAVGAELARLSGTLSYWREGAAEVDFVYAEGRELWAIEVKSGRKRGKRGLGGFQTLA